MALCLVFVALALTRGAAAEQGKKIRLLTFSELAACSLVLPPDDQLDLAPSALAATVRAATNQEVEITGYMLPMASDQGRTQEFLLMRNQSACCFGRMPGANEYVVVSAAQPGLPVRMDVPVMVRIIPDSAG